MSPIFTDQPLVHQISQVEAQRLGRDVRAQLAEFAVGDAAVLLQVLQGANLALVEALGPFRHCAGRRVAGGTAAALEDHREGVRRRLELRRGVTGLHHLLDHPVDAQAELLDVTPLEQPVDQPGVAREVLLDDVVQRDVTGQAAGAADLQPIVELADLDAAAGQPVVAVADRVDQRLAHGEQGINVPILALEAAHHGLAAHLLEQDGPAVLDDARQCAVELLAPACRAACPPGPRGSVPAKRT